MPHSLLALSSLVMDLFSWQIAIAGYILDDISTNGKIILHCLNCTKESYYFTSHSIELAFRFTSKRVNKNRAKANSNWKMPLFYLATMCHFIGCILWMIKHNLLHQKVNMKPISAFSIMWDLFKEVFYQLWNRKEW